MNLLDAIDETENFEHYLYYDVKYQPFLALYQAKLLIHLPTLRSEKRHYALITENSNSLSPFLEEILFIGAQSS